MKNRKSRAVESVKNEIKILRQFVEFNTHNTVVELEMEFNNQKCTVATLCSDYSPLICVTFKKNDENFSRLFRTFNNARNYYKTIEIKEMINFAVDNSQKIREQSIITQTLTKKIA